MSDERDLVEILRGRTEVERARLADVGGSLEVVVKRSEKRLRHPSKLAYEANLREALRHLERARESLLEAASHLEPT